MGKPARVMLGITVAMLMGALRRLPPVVRAWLGITMCRRARRMTWGWIPIDKPPVLTIQSGQTVRIDTISHQGSTQPEDPLTFLGALGVRPEEVLQDVRDFWASRSNRPRGEGRTGAHVLTGPIAVAGAEPGDMLEVQILDVSPRVSYGINTASATSGVFSAEYPGTRQGDPGVDISGESRNLIRTGMVDGRQVALFSDRIHVPLAPFMGTMAVAPRDPAVGQPGVTVARFLSSRPPGPYGGNMDLQALTKGATLFLPVFHAGALFYVGDPHGVQGDGEVSGNALEQSNSGVFRFILHRPDDCCSARRDPTHHPDGHRQGFNRALRIATLEVVNFLVKERD